MYRSPAQELLKSENTYRNLPIVKGRFNLNRYAEYAIAADFDRADSNRPPKRDFGRITFAETSNVMLPFRHAHGVCYPIIMPSTSDPNRVQPLRVVDMTDSKHDRIKPFIPSSENAYRYYISSTCSESNIDMHNLGYTSATGIVSSIKLSYVYPSSMSPDDPYFQLETNRLVKDPNNLYDDALPVTTGIPTKQMFLNGNGINFKFNTVYSTPRHFRIRVGWRPYDSTAEVATETVVFDSAVDGVPEISDGMVYPAVAISNSNGYCKVSLGSNIGLTIKANEYVVLANISNQINGIYKVLAVSHHDKSIVIDAPFSFNETFTDKGQIYSAYPGELSLFMPDSWNGTTHWSEQENYWTEDKDNIIGISYILLDVYSVSKKKSNCEIIEIMPALYVDFTSTVESVDLKMECSSNDPSQPIGALTANTGSVTFNNSSRLFDQSNYRRYTSAGWIGSPIASMLNGYVEFWIDNEFSSVESGETYVTRAGTFVADTWNSDSDSATVNLADYAKVMQERDTPDMLFRSSSWMKDRNSPAASEAGLSAERVYKNTFDAKGGFPVSAIVMTLMASAGWTQVLPWPETGSTDEEPNLRYFWCKSEQSVWETLQELASSTQTAIFFDRFGYLRVLPRDIFTDYQRGVEGINSWRFSATQQGDKAPDIIDISRAKGVPATKVRVQYNNYSSINERFAANTVFWTPPENMQLRLAELVTKVEKGTKKIKIKPRENSAPFPPSGSVVFSNMSVDYQASSFYRTFDLPRLGKKNSKWEKWWAADDDAVLLLKELNDGVDTVPGHELYIKNGLSGDEQTSTVSYTLNDPEDLTVTDGWRVRYVIDGANNRGGEIDGSQWRTFNRDNECWILNCRRGEFPRGIRIPANSDIQPRDQYLMAFRDFEEDDVENIDRIITKFQFTESQAAAAAGITLYNKMGTTKDRFYAVKVMLGDKYPGKKRNEPIVKMHRIDDDGTPFNLEATFVKEAGTSIEDYEWCILELEVIKAKEGDDGNYNYEFNLYLNGWKIGTFEDKTKKSIEPSCRAGFFVTNGIVEWDAFVVAEDGEDAPEKPAKTKKARKKLRGKMNKTKNKRKKESRGNKKSKGPHTRGNKANKPKGNNKSRNRNKKGK